MIITEIKQRRKHICGIKFDCEVNPDQWGADKDPVGWIALDSELCDIKHLKAGLEISEEYLSCLIEQSHIKRAKSRAMWYISRSDCPKKALIDKLKRSFPEYAANEAVDRMEELGLVDDENYAKRRIQRIIDGKNVSLRMAKQLLIHEGIDREIAEIAAETAKYDSESSIVTLIEKKYKNKIFEKSDLEKTIAALMRKGYNYSEIKRALENFNTELDYYGE